MFRRFGPRLFFLVRGHDSATVEQDKVCARQERQHKYTAHVKEDASDPCIREQRPRRHQDKDNETTPSQETNNVQDFDHRSIHSWLTKPSDNWPVLGSHFPFESDAQAMMLFGKPLDTQLSFSSRASVLCGCPSLLS
jgi:hypothetical protein